MTKPPENYVIYGGQYGSEGKGCVVEHYATIAKKQGADLNLIGDPAPNAGHSCSVGKTRCLPAGAFWANKVFLGPDAAIDPVVLMQDIRTVKAINPSVQIFIHAHAAYVGPEFGQKEAEAKLGSRISSTMTGGGYARCIRNLERADDSVIGHFYVGQGGKGGIFDHVKVQDPLRWHQHLIGSLQCDNAFNILECSQGVLLDVGLGRYPYVTSRQTTPGAAIARSGLDSIPWVRVGVYRTFPIRTGGPSGPTGGRELKWEELGVAPEIASVTKRVRRVFQFSDEDFMYSLVLGNPLLIYFTHMDYVTKETEVADVRTTFHDWLVTQNIQPVLLGHHDQVYFSFKAGEFHNMFGHE